MFSLPTPYTGEVRVPEVPSYRRAYLTKTQRRVLEHIEKHGPVTITWGRRHHVFTPECITLFAQAVHTLMTSGMIKKAGGNYADHVFCMTPYGKTCLSRGYRDRKFTRPRADLSSKSDSEGSK